MLLVDTMEKIDRTLYTLIVGAICMHNEWQRGRERTCVVRMKISFK